MRRSSRGAIVSLACVLLGAVAAGQQAPVGDDSWGRFRGTPPLTGTARGTLARPLKLAWSVQAQDGVASSAAIVNGVVYVGSRDGVLHAIDLATGKPRWQYSTNSSIEESSPAVLDDTVFVGDLDGVVHAVDVKTGKPRWTFKTDGEIHSSPNPAGDRVFIGSYDEHVYSLSVKTGALIWKFQASGPVHSTPSIDKDTVYVSGCDEQLRGIDASTGTQKFAVSLRNYTGASAAIAGTDAFVGTFGNEVVAVDLARRTLRWSYRNKVREMPFYSSAAVAVDRIVVGGRDKIVHCLARSTGRVLWTFATRARVDSSPIIVDGRVFVGSSDGNLYELDLATGKMVWTFTAGSALTASPAVAGGALVVGSQDGTIYCLR